MTMPPLWERSTMACPGSAAIFAATVGVTLSVAAKIAALPGGFPNTCRRPALAHLPAAALDSEVVGCDEVAVLVTSAVLVAVGGDVVTDLDIRAARWTSA